MMPHIFIVMTTKAKATKVAGAVVAGVAAIGIELGY
jgi:hypothetical protein